MRGKEPGLKDVAQEDAWIGGVLEMDPIAQQPHSDEDTAVFVKEGAMMQVSWPGLTNTIVQGDWEASPYAKTSSGAKHPRIISTPKCAPFESLTLGRL